MLLGDLNYALVPETNGPSRLYVFRTTRGNATQLVRPAALNSGKHAKHIPNQIIVKLKPGAKIEDLAHSLGAKIIGRMDAQNVYLLEFADEAAAQDAWASMSTNPDVAGLDYNYPMDPVPVPQILVNNTAPDWNLKPKDNTGPCNIIVAPIDDIPPGSVDQSLNPFLLPYISVVSNVPPATTIHHGDAMISIITHAISSKISSGQTSVKILPVNVFGANSSATTFDVGQGIYQAVNAGADIINLSLGGSGDSSYLHSLITSASQQGVVFFGAAGNQPVTTPTYPAAYPEVIAVTASGPNGQLANYADYGSFVSIIAPGTDTVNYNGQAYSVTGTSTATAFASGDAAGLADTKQECPPQVVPTIRSTMAVNFDSSQQ